MEMTFTNLMSALMQGYTEGKVLTIKTTREEHIKGASDIVKATVRADEETLIAFTIVFDGKGCKYKCNEGKPKSYYDEQDYEELIQLLEKVRC